MKSNSVLLIGYVGQHLLEKTLPSGSRMTMLRVATHHSWKDRDGNLKYSSVWHNVVAWDQESVYAQRNFVKGSRILVEGMILYRSYPDNKGHIRFSAEIKATSLLNLDR